MKKVLLGIVITSFLLLSMQLIGCAPKADKELADAEAALRAAQEAGAAELAPQEYESAQELINRAKDLLAQGKTSEARSLLEEARFKAIEAKGRAISAAAAKPSEEEMISIKESFSESDIGLLDIFFDFNRSNITPDARATLHTNAKIINNSLGSLRIVVVEGYCDIRGTEEYNLALGQRRAESSKSYLVGIGVPPTKIEAVSKGETEQWAPGTTEYAYQQNRRAHFIPVLMSPQALR